MGSGVVVVGQPLISSLIPQSVPPAGTGGYVRAGVGRGERGAAVEGEALLPQAPAKSATGTRAAKIPLDVGPRCISLDGRRGHPGSADITLWHRAETLAVAGQEPSDGHGNQAKRD